MWCYIKWHNCMKLPLTPYNKVEAHPSMCANCAYIRWYQHISPCQSFPGLWHSESTFSWITFPSPMTAQTDWAWKLSVCFAYRGFWHSTLLSPRQVISHSHSLIKIYMTRGDLSYNQGGGTVVLSLEMQRSWFWPKGNILVFTDLTVPPFNLYSRNTARHDAAVPVGAVNTLRMIMFVAFQWVSYMSAVGWV